MLASILPLILLLTPVVLAYVPALPTNDTNYGGIAGGPNVTDVSDLDLQWFKDK